MRTKSPPAKFRPSLMPYLRNGSVSSRFYLEPDNREYPFESEVLEKSCDGHDDGDAGNTEVEIVPDSFDASDVAPKKRRCLGINGASTSLDSVNKDTCILCGKADDSVLACSESGCPIALHKKCMDGEPDLEDVGGFYCPYCWYKKQILRSKVLREKAMAAEKALSDYLDEVMIGGNKEKDNVAGCVQEKTNESAGRTQSSGQSKDRMDVKELIHHAARVETDQQADKCTVVHDDRGNVKRTKGQKEGAIAKVKATGQFGVSESGKRLETENLEEAEESEHEGTAGDQRQGAMEEEKATNQFEDSEAGDGMEAENLDGAEKRRCEGMPANLQEGALEEEKATDQVSGDQDRVEAENLEKVEKSRHEEMAEDQQHEVHKEKRTTDEVEVSGDEERVEAENSEKSEESKLEETVKDQLGATERKRAEYPFELVGDDEEIQADNVRKNGDATHEQMVDDQQGEPHDALSGDKEKSPDEVFESIQETFGVNRSEEDEMNVRREEQTEAEEQTSNISSSGSTNNHTRNAAETRNVAMNLRQRRGKQAVKEEASTPKAGSSKKSSLRPSTSPVGNRSNRGKKVPATKASSAKREFPGGDNEKRKRLFWSAEEEEMLRIGMDKFSAQVQKKIPWRKILEFGRDIFDKTRTPSDLKDKWRNMMRK